MKVPLFTQRIFFYTSHGGYFVFHTEYHGISRRFLNIDYNSDNFSVAISKERKSVTIRDSPCEERKSVILRDSPCEERKTVILRDSPCEERKRDSPCEKKISLNK